jgi:hypothetical protein
LEEYKRWHATPQTAGKDEAKIAKRFGIEQQLELPIPLPAAMKEAAK